MYIYTHMLVLQLAWDMYFACAYVHMYCFIQLKHHQLHIHVHIYSNLHFIFALVSAFWYINVYTTVQQRLGRSSAKPLVVRVSSSYTSTSVSIYSSSSVVASIFNCGTLARLTLTLKSVSFADEGHALLRQKWALSFSSNRKHHARKILIWIQSLPRSFTGSSKTGLHRGAVCPSTTKVLASPLKPSTIIYLR